MLEAFQIFKKEVKFLAYANNNNNDKRNSTHSTPGCVIKLDWIQRVTTFGHIQVLSKDQL